MNATDEDGYPVGATVTGAERQARREGRDDTGTPAALAGQAQRLFDMLNTTLADLDAVDHPLAVDVAEQWSAELLRRFAP